MNSFNPYNPNMWEIDITTPTNQEYEIALDYFKERCTNLAPKNPKVRTNDNQKSTNTRTSRYHRRRNDTWILR